MSNLGVDNSEARAMGRFWNESAYSIPSSERLFLQRTEEYYTFKVHYIAAEFNTKTERIKYQQACEFADNLQIAIPKFADSPVWEFCEHKRKKKDLEESGERVLSPSVLSEEF